MWQPRFHDHALRRTKIFGSGRPICSCAIQFERDWYAELHDYSLWDAVGWVESQAEASTYSRSCHELQSTSEDAAGGGLVRLLSMPRATAPCMPAARAASTFSRLSSRKKTLAGSQPSELTTCSKASAVGLDPAGQVRDEAVLEESAEAELAFDAGPMQRIAVRKQRTRDVGAGCARPARARRGTGRWASRRRIRGTARARRPARSSATRSAAKSSRRSGRSRTRAPPANAATCAKLRQASSGRRPSPARSRRRSAGPGRRRRRRGRRGTGCVARLTRPRSRACSGRHDDLAHRLAFDPLLDVASASAAALISSSLAFATDVRPSRAACRSPARRPRCGPAPAPADRACGHG